MLFKRYASPFLLVDEMIRTRQLSDFILTMIKKENEQTQWEFWLHKVFDMGFDEYKEKCKQNNKQSFEMTKGQVDATINKSRGLLKKFSPK